MRLLSRSIVLLLAAGGAAPAFGQSQFRAFWADAFHAGYGSQAEADTMISRAVAGHYNAIIVEVLAFLDTTGGGHGAFWNSSLVPKVAALGSFDPLAYLCTKAHANNIEMHPWIYTYRCTITWPPSGNTIVQAHPEWVMGASSQINTGPQILAGSSHYWLDFGSPDVQEYYVNIVKELVTNYPIDGVHWDQEIPVTNCGYPSSNAYPFSGLTRYQRISGTIGTVPLTTDPNWQNFRRRCVDELVRRCRAEIPWIRSNPRQPLRHSASLVCSGDVPNATTCSFTNSTSWVEYMNWPLWLQQGWLDMGIPMVYKRQLCTTTGNQPLQYTHWVDCSMSTFRGPRHMVIGQACYLNTFDDSNTQMSYALTTKGADGCTNYSYTFTRYDPGAGNVNACASNSVADTSWYSTYISGAGHVYSAAASPPTMPWRNPATATEGTVWGRVTDEFSNPLDDATVDIIAIGSSCGSTPVQTCQSDGNGYFVLTLVPAVAPGTFYKLCASKTGFPSATVGSVSLAGDITRSDIALGGAPCHTPIFDTDNDGDVDLDDFGIFQRCYTGSQTPSGDAACRCYDWDADHHIDRHDFAIFMNCATRTGVPANPACDYLH